MRRLSFGSFDARVRVVSEVVSETIAQIYGRRWSAGAEVRAEHYAEMSRPAWEAVADATDIGSGTRLLDVACGSGEFAQLASERGAQVYGIDAAEAMIAVAATLAPGADLPVGTLESLPWPDAAFDVVTGFNAFQFAPDIGAALAEAARVTRQGGLVAVCNWGTAASCDLVPLTRAVQQLHPAPTLVARRPLGDDGVLEAMLRDVGMAIRTANTVAVPYSAPDQDTLIRDLLSAGNVVPVVEHAGESVVRQAIIDAAEPYSRADGSYLFHNTFRYVVAKRT